MSYTASVHSSNAATTHTAILVSFEACGADKLSKHLVQGDI